ncbi:hypothetical protein CP533_4501 [Ophiocordyceps camponoti-saundersi (nom. inval.)]|nr:hypothetical protein CP533_4501 [Ophiocordyceps camponoti-saundersi (nom. inval.)]
MRPTQALLVGRYRHLKLTTKDVNKGFYKGNRTGAMGRHTKWGGYQIDWARVRTYVVPENLEAFKVALLRAALLTPFVSHEVTVRSGEYKGLRKGPQSPLLYLEQWKLYNGVD